MAPKAPKGDLLQQKSPAEFFAENRTIAGFDNVRPCLLSMGGCRGRRPSVAAASPRRAVRPSAHPFLLPPATNTTQRNTSQQPGKCLYTTIRELVENALDAAESISQLPDIGISV